MKENLLMNKYSQKLLFLMFSLLAGCTFYPIEDRSDLQLYNQDFADIYSNRQEIVDLKTEGFYYRLDSTLVYEIDKKKKRYKFKLYFDPLYPGYGENYKTYKLYYLDYFWILKDGTVYCPFWQKHFAEFQVSFNNNFILIDDNKTHPNNYLIKTLVSRVEKEYRSYFWQNEETYQAKGVMQIYGKSRIKMYLYDVFGANPHLNLYHGRIQNDTTIVINREYIKFSSRPAYDREEKITEPWIYKFHSSDVYPSEKFMGFRKISYFKLFYRYLFPRRSGLFPHN